MSNTYSLRPGQRVVAVQGGKRELSLHTVLTLQEVPTSGNEEHERPITKLVSRAGGRDEESEAKNFRLEAKKPKCSSITSEKSHSLGPLVSTLEK